MWEKAESMWDLLSPVKASKSLAAEVQETQSLSTSSGVPWGGSPFVSQHHSAPAQHQSSIEYLPQNLSLPFIEPLCSELEPLSLQFLSLPCDAICQGFLRAPSHPSTTHKGVAGGCTK